jgi:hypothetical protein
MYTVTRLTRATNLETRSEGRQFPHAGRQAIELGPPRTVPLFKTLQNCPRRVREWKRLWNSEKLNTGRVAWDGAGKNGEAPAKSKLDTSFFLQV